MDRNMVPAVALVKASRYRQKVLVCLAHRTMTPSEISREVGIRLNHISMTLSGMKDQGIVKCLNEQDKRGRLYELTDLGRRVLAHEKSASA